MSETSEPNPMSISVILAPYASLAPGETSDSAVTVQGEVCFRNRMGRAVFVRITDGESTVYLYAHREQQGDAVFEVLRTLDIGQRVVAAGRPCCTKQGDLCVVVGGLLEVGPRATDAAEDPAPVDLPAPRRGPAPGDA